MWRPFSAPLLKVKQSFSATVAGSASGDPRRFCATGEAVTTYNLLRETERVGALIHSTC
jgi:hypothetical protein